MKWITSSLVWGTLLIIGGILILLQTLGFYRLGDLFWGLLALLGGIFFLGFYVQNHSNWWGFIPSFTLFGLSATLLLGALAPQLNSMIGGSVFLGGIGLSFLAVYLADRRNWWAIIPMGVLLTLAAVSALDQFGGLATGGFFFVGMGLTFLLVALLPTPSGRMTWAWIPAAVLLIMGVLLMATAEKLIVYILPLAFILGGIFLLIRAYRPRKST